MGAPRQTGLLVWALSLAVGGLHYWEVVCHHHLLDNLSVEEQKVAALKTENAFYYSYFEETVAAPSLAAAVGRALHDRRSEAPEVINAVRRFNIYQELASGLAYRALSCAVGRHRLPAPWYFFRHCSYTLQAIGHAALVHLAAGCAGGGVLGAVLPCCTLACLLFLLRYHISRIHDVGMLNLRENWAMPVVICQVLALQRLLVHHPALLGCADGGTARVRRWAFRLMTAACILLWQFSAFAFLLQVSAVLLCALLAPGPGPRRVAADVAASHLVSAGIAAVMLFGNELLLHHMLVTQCVAILLVLRLRPLPPRWRILFWVDGALAVVLFVAIRLLQSRWATAEEHIGEIFQAKVRQLYPGLLAKAKEPTFNARLYLAVSVFDFIDWGTVTAATPTGLYHGAAVGALLWSAAFARRVVLAGRPRAPAEPEPAAQAAEAADARAAGGPPGRAPVPAAPGAEGLRRRRAAADAGGGLQAEPGHPGGGGAAAGAGAGAAAAPGPATGASAAAGAGAGADAAQAAAAPAAAAFAQGVLLVQLVFLLALGCFISRLKVIGAPFLCLLAAVSLAPGPLELALGGLDGAPPRRARCWRALRLAATAAQMGQVAFAARRLPFLKEDGGESRLRDFVWADGDRGELYEWLTRRLAPGTVVLTSMPLSAELRLNTPLRLAIHPQFEAQSLRDRVQELYQFYQCTPAEAFANTMHRYNSSHLVLEYKRCDFGPFKLDRWQEYNCEKGARPWEDLFCPRAHASTAWELLFANAGFAVLRLRAGGERRPELAPKGIDDPQAWLPMLERCLWEEPEACVSRTAELAQMFHAKLGKQRVAKVLFDWVREHAGRDGQAQYVLGHHYDYDLGRQKQAAGHYKKAVELAPNNPLILREYLVWLDVEAKDNRSLTRLMLPRRFTKGGRLSLLDLGDVALACEASVPAVELFRDLDWAEELWELARRDGLGSSCVRNNWPLRNGGRSMDDELGKWGSFASIYWRRALRSELVSTQSNGVRYQRPRRAWALGLAASFEGGG